MERFATRRQEQIGHVVVAAWGGLTFAAAVIFATAPAVAPDAAVNPRGVLPGFLLASGIAGVALLWMLVWTRRDPVPPLESRPMPWLPFLAILMLAALLRGISLGSELWYDEVFTLVNFVRLPVATLMASYGTQNNHMLYSLMAHVSAAAFGESPAALRVPALLFGVGGVAAVFALGRRVGNDRVGLAAATLIAVSYHHVWFSQNARAYTTILCLATLATAWFLDGLKTRRRKLWLAYPFLVAAAMYAHLSAVFVFAVHGGVYLALFLASRWRPALAEKYPGATEWWPFASFALAALLIVQAYSPVLPSVFAAFNFAVTTGAAGTGPGVEEWRNPWWTLMAIAESIPGGTPVFLVLGLAIAVAGWVWLHLLARDPAAAWILALPIPVTLTVLVVASMHIWPRYFFLYFGFVAVLIVEGLFFLATTAGRLTRLGERRADRLGLLLMAFLLLGSLATVPRNYQAPKQPYLGAKSLAEAQQKPGETIASIGLAAVPYSLYYAPEWPVITELEQLVELEQETDGVWLIYSFGAHMRAHHPDVLQALLDRYDRVEVLPGTLGDGDFHVYHRSTSRD